MKMQKRRAMPLLVGAAVTLGWFGVVAAQQQDSARVDLEQVVAQLELSADVQKQIGPELDRLNELIARQAELGQQGAELRNELADIRGKIAAALTPEQWRRFRIALYRTWASQGFGRRSGMQGMRGRMGHRGGSHGPGMMGGAPMMRGQGAGCGGSMMDMGRESGSPGQGS